MGVLMSRMMAAFGDKEAPILVLGLDNAGKTTILYRLQVGAVVSTIPTIGFNVETVTFKNVKFQVWDLGGQTSIRPYWRCYYPNTTAIVYVVDSCDKERIPTSKEELQGILEEDELRDCIIMVFANKQDLPEAATEVEITEGLGLNGVKDRQWAIFKTSALKGEGLWEGMEWLSASCMGSSALSLRWTASNSATFAFFARSASSLRSTKLRSASSLLVVIVPPACAKVRFGLANLPSI